MSNYKSPDELFGPADPERSRKLAYVQAAHRVRSSIFASLAGNAHRSDLAAHALWAGGHYHLEHEHEEVDLSQLTIEKMRRGWEKMGELDSVTLERVWKAAKKYVTRAPDAASAEVAKRVEVALRAILEDRRSGSSPVRLVQPSEGVMSLEDATALVDATLAPDPRKATYAVRSTKGELGHFLWAAAVSALGGGWTLESGPDPRDSGNPNQ